MGKENGMEKQFINPPGLSMPRGYTHVVSIQGGGKTAFISGQIAVNPQGEMVGRNDLRRQAEQVYENLKVALASAGASLANVVKMNTYIVNFKPQEHLSIIREVRSHYLPEQNPPASTLTGVQSLALDGLLIEIEAVAVLG